MRCATGGDINPDCPRAFSRTRYFRVAMSLAADSCRARDWGFVRTVTGTLSSALVEPGSVAEAFSNFVDQFPGENELSPRLMILSILHTVHPTGFQPRRVRTSRKYGLCIKL
jgi:hypothetical protein